MKNLRFIRAILCAVVLTLTGGCATSYTHLDELRSENAEKDQLYLYSNINLPDQPLSLEEVIDIALCRNLDLLVKEFEAAVQNEIASSENLKMLPSLRMNYDSTGRNKNSGSASESLTNIPPAPPSISRDQHIKRWDTTFTWNVLDFGISYLRARQEANRAVIKEMEYCRISQNLILEVTKQYWQTVISKQAVNKSRAIIDEAIAQRKTMSKNAKLRVIAQNADFSKQDQLLRIERTLHVYEKNSHIAKAELTRLMGLPPGTDFELKSVLCQPLSIDLGSVGALQEMALTYRPELYSSDLEEKIDADQVRQALVRMVPGLTLFSSDNWDSNSFLVNNYWLEAGLRTAWDLLTLPATWKEKRGAEAKIDQTHATRLALSMGAMTQVYLAYKVYHDDLIEYGLASEHSYVKERLYEIAKNRTRVGLMGFANLLEYRADALDLEIEALEAYGNVQIALEQLNNAIGMPGYFRVNCEEESDSGDKYVASSD